MAKKYNLHHWDNPYLKSLLIVIIGGIKNTIYLIYDDKEPVATFQVKRIQNALHFEKLGTLPQNAGHGLGSYCMIIIEEMAVNMNCNKVFMEVYGPSQHAILFYEHRGYKRAGIKETLKYNEIVMEKGV